MHRLGRKMAVSFLLVKIYVNFSHAGILKGPREPTFEEIVHNNYS